MLTTQARFEAQMQGQICARNQSHCVPDLCTGSAQDGPRKSTQMENTKRKKQHAGQKKSQCYVQGLNS